MPSTSVHLCSTMNKDISGLSFSLQAAYFLHFYGKKKEFM